MLSEAQPVHVDQGAAVAVFLCLHLFEHLRRGRICFPQAIHEVAINAAVFLLEGNGQRQDLPLGQFLEILCHEISKSAYGYIDG